MLAEKTFFKSNPLVYCEPTVDDEASKVTSKVNN